MKFLPDTHLLLWTAGEPGKLPKAAREIIADPAHELFFSAVSIWEIAIKRALGRSNFQADPNRIRLLLLANGYVELPLTGDHGLAILGLPPIHQDPFDRILIAQTTFEGITLLTVDTDIAKYPGPIRKV
jgi:PIN domain nuclease of toxin-antitoxin system